VTQLTLALLILVAAVLVSIAAEILKFPYTIALVAVGLIVGNAHLLQPVSVSPDVLLTIVIPPLLFEGGLRLPPVHLRAFGWLIALLALPGTAAAAGAIAWAAAAVAHMDLHSAFVLGAAASAIDPVSVIALMRELGVNIRLATILEAEAVLNDGIAIVLFALGASLTPADPLRLVGGFLWLVGAGAAAGILSAGMVAYGLSKTQQAHVEALGSLIAALGSLVLAEAVHGSGVIAVAAAGVTFGSYGIRFITEEGQDRVRTLWDTIAFLANSVLFLLIGLQVPISLLARHGGVVAVVILAALAVRAATVAGLCLPRWPLFPPLPRAWALILTWAALRGGVTIALGLSADTSAAARDSVRAAIFGLVVFTLIAQGLSIRSLLRRLDA
jgi:CPA1 family monovalent cation:H+ antiporter